MSIKLGDRVKFSRELVKSKYNGWHEVQHQEKLTGIICGKRTIGHRDYNGRMLTFKKKVYLIATDLHSFHRVQDEWLEPVSN